MTTDTIAFDKYTAHGNDYLMLADPDIDLTADDIIGLCDRRFGVGADGVLVCRVAPTSLASPAQVQIFNSDGSECERSGNGLRIFSQWLRDQHLEAESPFFVECLAGRSMVIVEPDGGLTLSMGTPTFDPRGVGITDTTTTCVGYELTTSYGPVDVTSLSVGNPHTVVFTPIPVDSIEQLGNEIATHSLFTGGTNVQFVTAVGPTGIDIEIWERGAGRTLASGSSACAAAIATARRGLAELPMTVRMPGGAIDVAVREGEIWQTGRAHRVFSGYVSQPYTKVGTPNAELEIVDQ